MQKIRKKFKDESTANLKCCLIGIGISCITGILLLVFMMIPSANLQILSMFLVVITCALFFSSNDTFITAAFPPKLIGSLYGVISATAGLMLFLQIPLRSLVTDVLDNNFLPVTSGLFVMSFLLLLHPFIIHKYMKKVKKQGEKNDSIELETMSNIENYPEALFLNDFDLFRKPSHVSEILCDAYD